MRLQELSDPKSRTLVRRARIRLAFQLREIAS
jgi:hypothetical protein